jgi:hypothetical protein
VPRRGILTRSRFGASATAPALRTFNASLSSGTENPLSEGGVWVNGGTVGGSWYNFRKSGGKCWGLQVLDERDATALVAGGTWATTPWSNRQYATATVYIDGNPSAYLPELELRLRSNISSGFNNGYEIDWPIAGGLQIVRWNGGAGSYNILQGGYSSPAFTTGDVVYAEIVGNIITAKVNGTTVATLDVSLFDGSVIANGSPGMGHNHVGAIDGSEALYGFTAFAAGEL